MRDRRHGMIFKSVWAKVALVVVGILMARVWEHVHALRLERRVKALRLEADRLTYDNGRLQSQIHHYVAPSNLEALAKAKFHMVPVESTQRVGLQP